MFNKLEIFQMASALASHASARQNAVAQNVANADTPGYRARDLASFTETYQTGAAPHLRATRPGHIGAGASGYEPRMVTSEVPGTRSPNGNSVSLENEMVRGIEIKRQHDRALAIYRSSMGILRTALGRGQ